MLCSLGTFLEDFDVCLAFNRVYSLTVEEILLHSPFRDKGQFMWRSSIFAVLVGSLDCCFGEIERSKKEVWSLAKLHLFVIGHQFPRIFLITL